MGESLLKRITNRIFGSSGPDLTGRNIVISGVPRSGTTLTCFLLTEAPNSVGLNEPVRIGQLRERAKVIEGVNEFFRVNRHTLLTEGKAIARASKKGIVDNNFSRKGDRESVARKQEVQIEKELSPDFYLCVKHNAAFTILMEELQQIYPFYGQVRNPIPVLGSWNSLNLPASRGEVRAADWLGDKLHQELQTMPDLYDRQLHILDWYYRNFTRLPEEKIIRYEEVVRTNGRSLARVVPTAADINYPLESKNKSKIYDSEVMKRLGEKLLNQKDHACWYFYQREEVEALLP